MARGKAAAGGEAHKSKSYYLSPRAIDCLHEMHEARGRHSLSALVEEAILQMHANDPLVRAKKRRNEVDLDGE